MTLTLYTKPHCHLCEEAKTVLTQFQSEHPFTLELFDITTDPTIFEKYKHDIPVLTQDGTEIARHSLNLKKLRLLIQRSKK